MRKSLLPACARGRSIAYADSAATPDHVVTRPPHVDIDYLSIKPTEQATARDVHRERG